MRATLRIFLLLFLATTAHADNSVNDLRIPLDQFAEITLNGFKVQLAVHDDGGNTIKVATAPYARPVTVEKARGIDPRTDETLIYRGPGCQVYYVTEISGKIGYCLLRIRNE